MKREDLLRPEDILLLNGISLMHNQINQCTSYDIIQELICMYYKGINPIRIYMSSPGGSVFSGLAILDFIRELTKKGIEVITVGQGEIASMGSILFQTGTTRIMAKHSYMMIHEISSFTVGKTSEKEDELKLCKRIQNEVILPMYAERSKLSIADIKRKWLRKDWWLNAQEAKELGFCDIVV